MLLITRGTNNTLIMTLTEKSTLTNPYYLMKMVNDLTYEVKRFVLAADLSSYTYRYNKFTLTEVNIAGAELLTSGTVMLKPAGFWTYTVYEQTSSTSLVVENATTLVETGKAKVIGTDTEYTQHQAPTSYKAYGTGT